MQIEKEEYVRVKEQVDNGDNVGYIVNGVFGVGKTTLIEKICSSKDAILSMWDDMYRVDPYLFIISRLCLKKKFMFIQILIIMLPIAFTILSIFNLFFYDPIVVIDISIYSIIFGCALLILVIFILYIIVFCRLEIYTMFYNIHLVSNSLYVDTTINILMKKIKNLDYLVFEDIDRLSNEDIDTTLMILNRLARKISEDEDVNTKIIITCDMGLFNENDVERNNISKLSKLQFTQIDISKPNYQDFIVHSNFKSGQSYTFLDYLSYSKNEYILVERCIDKVYGDSLSYRDLNRWNAYTSKQYFDPHIGFLEYVFEFIEMDGYNNVNERQFIDVSDLSDKRILNVHNGINIRDVFKLLYDDVSIFAYPRDTEKHSVIYKGDIFKLTVYKTHIKHDFNLFINVVMAQFKAGILKQKKIKHIKVENDYMGENVISESTVETLNSTVNTFYNLLNSFSVSTNENMVEFYSNELCKGIPCIKFKVKGNIIELMFSEPIPIDSKDLLFIDMRIYNGKVQNAIDFDFSTEKSKVDYQLFFEQFQDNGTPMMQIFLEFSKIFSSIINSVYTYEEAQAFLIISMFTTLNEDEALFLSRLDVFSNLDLNKLLEILQKEEYKIILDNLLNLSRFSVVYLKKDYQITKYYH